MKGSLLTFKGSIVTFGIVGALALALSATTSFAQASYADASNLTASNSLLALVRGGGGGGGHGGFGGDGFGGGHVDGGFGLGHIGGFGFGGGHVGGIGGSRIGRIDGGHGFHGGHLRRFGFYDDYGYDGCPWSPSYHRWDCPYY